MNRRSFFASALSLLGALPLVGRLVPERRDCRDCHLWRHIGGLYQFQPGLPARLVGEVYSIDGRLDFAYYFGEGPTYSVAAVLEDPFSANEVRAIRETHR